MKEIDAADRRRRELPRLAPDPVGALIMLGFLLVLISFVP